MGVPLEFHSYPGMAHSSCPEEMRDVKSFIEKLTSAPVKKAPPPTSDEVDTMSVKELKAYLQSRYVVCIYRLGLGLFSQVQNLGFWVKRS